VRKLCLSLLSTGLLLGEAYTYSGDYFGLGKNYIKDFSIPVLRKEEEDTLLSLTSKESINKFLGKKYKLTSQMSTMISQLTEKPIGLSVS